MSPCWRRNGANLTVFYEAYDFTFGKGVLLTAYLNVADVARYAYLKGRYQFFSSSSETAGFL